MTKPTLGIDSVKWARFGSLALMPSALSCLLASMGGSCTPQTSQDNQKCCPYCGADRQYDGNGQCVHCGASKQWVGTRGMPKGGRGGANVLGR